VPWRGAGPFLPLAAPFCRQTPSQKTSVFSDPFGCHTRIAREVSRNIEKFKNQCFLRRKEAGR
jgi:hypothetical protein